MNRSIMETNITCIFGSIEGKKGLKGNTVGSEALCGSLCSTAGDIAFNTSSAVGFMSKL